MLAVDWDSGVTFTTNISIDLPAEIQQRLKVKAAERGIPLAELLLEILTREAGAPIQPSGETGKCLMDIGASVRGLFTDEEIDRMFARNRS